MTTPQPVRPCPACARLDRARAGQDPLFICELRQSFVLLHKHQPYPGWCSLFTKQHHEHLDRMTPAAQRELWDDVMQVAAAIRTAFSLRRLNYENLGNVVPHVHWHVIPRYEFPRDPDPGSVIWVRPTVELESRVNPGLAQELILRLRDSGLGPYQ